MKNKYTKYISMACLVIFSLFSFLINFSFTNKTQAIKIEEQKQLEIIIEKERPFIEALSSANFIVIQQTANIMNMSGFDEFRNAVNSGTTFSGYTINLRTDLNFSGTTYIPVGTKTQSATYYFGGTFDGNNHALTNVNIASDSINATGDIGVFGYVNGATIKNLTVSISRVEQTTNDVCVGGLIGYASGSSLKVTDIMVLPANSKSIIFSNNNLNASSNAGGIVGYVSTSHDVRISKCANFVTISNIYRNTASVGGIVGKINPSSDGYVIINACYNQGDIVSGSSYTNTTYAGGIVGFSSNKDLRVYYCSSNSKITAASKCNTDKKNNIKDDLEIFDSLDLTLQAVNKTYFDYNSYAIKAGGIIGDGAGCAVDSCVTNKSDYSVFDSIYTDTINYFYGSIDCMGDEIMMDSWFGDYFDITITQKIKNFREIGHNVSANRCFAPSLKEDYYTLSVLGNMYDRIYRAKITGVAGSGSAKLNIDKLTLTEVVSEPNKNLMYIDHKSKESYSGQIITIPIGGRNVSISSDLSVYRNVYRFGNVYYTNSFDVVDNANVWHLCDIYNYYNPPIRVEEGVFVDKYYFGVGSNIIGAKATKLMLDEYGVHAIDCVPHYANKNNQSFQLTLSGNCFKYSSYYAARLKTLMSAGINHYDSSFHTAMKDCNFSIKQSSNKYIFTHNYTYECFSFKWDSETSSYDLLSTTDRTVSNNKMHSELNKDGSTLNALRSSYSSWVYKNGVFAFKWLYWGENTTPIDPPEPEEEPTEPTTPIKPLPGITPIPGIF